MIRPAFRFAPSPNGRLHLGHAYSALLNEQAARRRGGRFLIRVEDIDVIRCSASLAEAVLADLEWLRLRSDEPVVFQSRHFADYRSAQKRLQNMGLLYPCFCSRQEISAVAKSGKRDPEGQPIYPGTCRSLTASERNERLAADAPYAWRIDLEAGLAHLTKPLTFLEESTGLREPADSGAWGDVILARKDIGTSYHIAVVVDDARQEISHIMRGRDLYAATAIHRMLQELLGFPEPVYHHHELIGDVAGRKLSKSAGDRSLASLRQEGITPGEVRRTLGF